MTEPASCPWQPIATAPRDRRVDLWAEKWSPGVENTRGGRFADCLWSNGGSIGRPAASWKRLPVGWRATHWMEPAAPPIGHRAPFIRLYAAQ